MIYKRLKAVLQDEPQLFCALFTGCMARRKFWASLRYKTCANLSNPDGMTIFLWQYARRHCRRLLLLCGKLRLR